MNLLWQAIQFKPTYAEAYLSIGSILSGPEATKKAMPCP